MKVIKQYFRLEDDINGSDILKKIERAGRTCYKSEDKISDESAQRFISSLLKRGHESVLEHEKITARVVTDRGVTHEIVRHRIASYSQESTRYCNYSSDKFGNELTFIEPAFWEDEPEKRALWLETLSYIEEKYFKLIAAGATPEEARTILPNSLKTELVMTMNLREWRHFFKLRCDKAAHPQIRLLAQQMLVEFKQAMPVVFDDIQVNID